ncbi:MAG: hypothetical protein B6U89_05500 [Desulfurococcales archaeon ex4484_58]|nr:MAG: hypothetical protein B6U89_05500 [Desulfurococcales archaeon ex4484_58]
MKAITNYIAAIITATMIFTSVAFFIISSLRQIELSNYALNTMVEISDRARERLSISYVIRNQTIIITLVNTGSTDVTLKHAIVIDQNLTVYKLDVNYTTITMGSVTNLELPLPVPPDQLYTVKLTTTRGNVFDVLSSMIKPIDIYVFVNETSIQTNQRFEIKLVIRNNLHTTLTIKSGDIDISFINHVTGENISTYFTGEKVFPNKPIEIQPSQQVIYVFVYEYSGGLTAGTPVDIDVFVHALTIRLEDVYSSITSIYCFETS